MTTEVKQLYDSALRLSESDRAELAGLLIDSLEQGCDDDVQQTWSDEIARRLEELDNGSVKPIPWSEVRRRMTREAK